MTVPAVFGVLLPAGPSDWMPVHGAALALAAIALAVRPCRLTALAVAGVALGLQLTGAEAAFTVTIMWVSLALALFSGAELAVALRWIGATIYAFAAANKAASEAFMSGDVFWREQLHIPHLRRLAMIVVIGEFALALTVFGRYRFGPLAILAFHLPAAFVLGDDWMHVVTLLAYGAVMAWVAWHAQALASAEERCGQVGQRLATGERLGAAGLVGGELDIVPSGKVENVRALLPQTTSHRDGRQ